MTEENTIGIGTKIYKPIDTPEKMHFRADCANWCNVNGADLVDKGDYYEICERVAPPLPELEDYKEQRKNELETLHRAAEKEAHILSSLGFEINAGDTANRDITGIVRKLTRKGGTEIFMDYSNNPHEITLQDAETMLDELFANAQYLYSQKWNYRTQIEACESSYALSQLNFQFFYQSFYQEQTDTGEQAAETESTEQTE